MNTFDNSSQLSPGRTRQLASRKPDKINGGPVPIQCQYCSGQTFRRSRLRQEDFWQIFLMRYPVRCLRCSQRQMVSFTVAGISVSSLTKHTRPVRTQDTWKNWTEPSGDSSSHIAIKPPRHEE